MAEWYALTGDSEWAIVLNERLLADGWEASPLWMARCYWDLGRLEDAP